MLILPKFPPAAGIFAILDTKLKKKIRLRRGIFILIFVSQF